MFAQQFSTKFFFFKQYEVIYKVQRKPGTNSQYSFALTIQKYLSYRWTKTTQPCNSISFFVEKKQH